MATVAGITDRAKKLLKSVANSPAGRDTAGRPRASDRR